MFDGSTRINEGDQIDCGGTDWRRIDRALRTIAKRRNALDREEAAWLVQAERAKVHVRVGCGSFLEYLERVLGYGPRTAIDRWKVARALDELPALRGADLPFSALRELARVVTPETVGNWLEACRGKSLREIEAVVSGRRRGDQPDGPRGPANQVLRLELAPETVALLREARRALADERGHAVDDNALLDELCRTFMTGGVGSKKSTYQIAITTCEACGRTQQDGGGVTVDVSPAVRDQAACDATHIGRLDAPTPIPPTIDIPAAVRARVWRRDHGCCRVPGCRAKRNLELHHIKHREHGGTHDLENITLICSGHHAAHHAGTLQITGTGSDPRFVWLRDPTPPAPDTTTDDAVAALTTMGLSPRAARAAVETAAAHVGENPAFDTLLRAALQSPPPATAATDDAIAALTAMGFSSRAARAAVETAAVHVGANPSVEILLRAALRVTNPTRRPVLT